MLAELEDLKIEKEAQAAKVKVTNPKPSASTAARISERGVTRSWNQEKPKKTKKQLKNEYRLPLEKYGPQWLEISKLIEFASHLSREEIYKVNNTYHRLTQGFPNEAFQLGEVTELTPYERKQENQRLLKHTRVKALKLLTDLGRESAINDFLAKAPLFEKKGIAFDTILALILRDELSIKDYDLLSWSWRVSFFRIHLEDPFINNPEETA